MGNPVGRTIAFWLGLFALASAAGSENLWWIDLRPLPQVLAGAAGAVLLAHAVAPRRFRGVVVATVALLLVASVVGTVRYYRLDLFAAPAVPFTAVVAGLLVLILRSPAVARPRLAVAATSLLLLFGLPLSQAWFFGTTDYRRPADAIVVFGARCHADGRASRALADRVHTACDLWHDGYAPRLLLSGGPGQGAVHETEAMRRLALAAGVPAEAIDLDPQGMNTEATVAHSGDGPVLAVSQFWHLPRIRMAYRTAGRTAYTVPARASGPIPQTPRLMLREAAAFWWYWARGLGA